jgi:quercetin dioxygenase-like cupin family protein
MLSRLFICGAGVLVAMAVVPAQVRDSRTTTDSGISRRLTIDEKTVQVVRSTYESGAHEPPGPHSFDVVIVPLTEGSMQVEIEGKTVAWKVGEPIFIPRGIKHSLANEGKTAVDLIGIRIP